MQEKDVADTGSLLSAIAAVATVRKDQVRTGRSGWGCAGQPWSRDTSKLYPNYGVHSHVFPELCIALDGVSGLVIGERLHAMRAPALALIEPGVVHGEGFTDKRRRYSILWLHYCSESSMIAVLSQYAPGAGWSCPLRYSLRAAMMQHLMTRLNAPGGIRADQLETVRADVLFILNEMHRRDIYSRKGDGSQRRLNNNHQILERVREYIDSHFHQPLSIEDVANITRLTPNYLNSLFSRWMGRSIHEYLMDCRMHKALELCHGGEVLIKEIARQVGYSDPLYFSRAFKQYYGYWPTEVE